MVDDKEKIIDSKKNLRKYFLPVYYVWAIVSPTLILIVHNIPFSRYPAFYGIWGLIWPLSFVIYPAFLKSFQVNNDKVTLGPLNLNDKVTLGPLNLAIPIFFAAWLGPVVHLSFAFFSHKKYMEKEYSKKISWSDYFFGFI